MAGIAVVDVLDFLVLVVRSVEAAAMAMVMNVQRSIWFWRMWRFSVFGGC